MENNQQPCPYEASLAEDAEAQKRWNVRVLVEPLIILAFILGYCVLQANMQHRDEANKSQMLKAEIAKLKSPQTLTCILKQNGMQFEYPNCTLLNDKYARLN
jgi:hypothetical protein